VRVIIGMSDQRTVGGGAAGDFSNGTVCDRYRWVIASHILKIQQALGK